MTQSLGLPLPLSSLRPQLPSSHFLESDRGGCLRRWQLRPLRPGDGPDRRFLFRYSGISNLGTMAWLRGITINGPGTYAKIQLITGLDLTTPVSGHLFAPATRPKVPVRMTVITGIPSQCPVL